MGGEPTFVSIDDMEGAEWNTEADGAHKRQLADVLVRRLREAFGRGGLLHFGQGKWYPGEDLPRWAYGCFWRKDGLPVWREPALLAEVAGDYGFTPADAERFAGKLAQRLGLQPQHVVPGYEDAFYYLWKEGTLPENVDPLQADLKDPLERRYLAQLLDKGLGVPTGYALPLQWDPERGGWRSGLWSFRRGRMFLIPGGSAMGLRLPLDSLPWVAPEEREMAPENDRSRACRLLRITMEKAADKGQRSDRGGESAAHGPLRRGARRTAARVHGAADAPRAVPRPGRRRRGDRRRAGAAGGRRRL